MATLYGNLSSPQNFIDWGFRYLIGASLQRRVWIGSDEQECFPNTYTILCGNPGVGKGLVIRPVTGLLRHWRLKDALKINGHELSKEQQATIDTIHQQDQQDAQLKEMQPGNKQAQLIEPLLIPVAADATTYEALVKAVSEANRRVNYTVTDPTTQKVNVKFMDIRQCVSHYRNYPLCLENEQMIQLLTYLDLMIVHLTTSMTPRLKVKIESGEVVSISWQEQLPDSCKESLMIALSTEGFSSRAFFIYAAKNKKSQFLDSTINIITETV
jgi:hypothetical protein